MIYTIIDNITLDDVLKALTDEYGDDKEITPLEMSYCFPDYSVVSSASWQQFITSLILWNKIEYLNTINDSGRYELRRIGFDILSSHHIHLDDVLISKTEPIESYDTIINYSKQYADEYCKGKTLPTVMDNWHDAFTFWKQGVNRIVSPSDALEIIKIRTFYFLVTCSVLNVNYLPHPFRSNFIEKEKIFENYFKPQVTRNDFLSIIDKNLLEYCNVINNKFGRKQFTLKYPLLYDFIKKSSNSKIDELKTALSLRNEQDVIQFRNEMSAIEDKIQKGDMQLAERVFDSINECADSVISKYKIKRKVGDLSLGLSPAFIRPIHLPQLKPLHLTFLTKLVDFGIHNRI